MTSMPVEVRVVKTRICCCCGYKSVSSLNETSSSAGALCSSERSFRVVVIIMFVVACFATISPAHADQFQKMFGLHEVPQSDINVFPQWVSVLDQQSATKPECSKQQDNGCAVAAWQQFLQGIRHLPAAEQLQAVNRFANKHSYVGDTDNYGAEDYWARPSQFLNNGGDCEDFAITKFLSLKQLGWPPESMRIVVVQDTKLKMPHAVLAVVNDEQLWILDNQTQKIVSDQAIAHYTPVYSLSDGQWWLHKPQI